MGAYFIPRDKFGCVRWLSAFYGDRYKPYVYRAKRLKELQGWINDIRQRGLKSLN